MFGHQKAQQPTAARREKKQVRESAAGRGRPRSPDFFARDAQRESVEAAQRCFSFFIIFFAVRSFYFPWRVRRPKCIITLSVRQYFCFIRSEARKIVFFLSKCHELWLRASACARGTQNCLGGESHSGQSKLIERGDVFKTIKPADLRYLIGKRERLSIRLIEQS